MTALILIATIVGLVGIAVWFALLLWAAKSDGRIQAEHDRKTR